MFFQALISFLTKRLIRARYDGRDAKAAPTRMRGARRAR
jgi:hypothetical protein